MTTDRAHLVEAVRDIAPRAILLDYGGTLDTRAEHWSEVILRAYRQEGIGIGRDRFWEAYVHAERALDGTGIIAVDDTFLDLMRKKISLQLDYLGDIDGAISPRGLSRTAPSALADSISARCYESARECINEIRPALEVLAENYPLGIVSNFYGNLRAVLADMELLHLFKSVTDSGATGIRKPDPRIFTIALDALNRATDANFHPGDTLMVGDSMKNDILPASSLGFMTALVTGSCDSCDSRQKNLLFV